MFGIPRFLMFDNRAGRVISGLCVLSGPDDTAARARPSSLLLVRCFNLPRPRRSLRSVPPFLPEPEGDHVGIPKPEQESDGGEEESYNSGFRVVAPLRVSPQVDHPPIVVVSGPQR